MRVISGKARGTKLNSIEDLSTRPTLDRVKESLFNILQNEIKDKIILDLFAGSGALRNEALSRRGYKAYFCDINKQSIEFRESTLEKTKLKAQSYIFNCDYKKCILDIKEKIDLVFVDPPYKADVGVDAINKILNQKILKQDGIIILETDEIERDLKELKNIKNIEI